MMRCDWIIRPTRSWAKKVVKSLGKSTKAASKSIAEKFEQRWVQDSPTHTIASHVSLLVEAEKSEEAARDSPTDHSPSSPPPAYVDDLSPHYYETGEATTGFADVKLPPPPPPVSTPSPLTRATESFQLLGQPLQMISHGVMPYWAGLGVTPQASMPPLPQANPVLYPSAPSLTGSSAAVSINALVGGVAPSPEVPEEVLDAALNELRRENSYGPGPTTRFTTSHPLRRHTDSDADNRPRGPTVPARSSSSPSASQPISGRTQALPTRSMSNDTLVDTSEPRTDCSSSILTNFAIDSDPFNGASAPALTGDSNMSTNSRRFEMLAARLAHLEETLARLQFTASFPPLATPPPHFSAHTQQVYHNASTYPSYTQAEAIQVSKPNVACASSVHDLYNNISERPSTPHSFVARRGHSSPYLPAPGQLPPHLSQFPRQCIPIPYLSRSPSPSPSLSRFRSSPSRPQTPAHSSIADLAGRQSDWNWSWGWA
ncbi:hypothetical protein DL93DRAFT_2072938 [Clavulina sp. PMI_390]|nr:hypothetical protein DL93DRAFT_2072938 [Clavulina sp. PMI_390]